MMKRRNICITIHSLSSKGGEERICTVLANSLSQSGYNVIVVTLEQHRNKHLAFPLEKAIKYYTLCGSRVERKLFRVFSMLPLLRYKRILAHNKIDVVIDVDIHQSLVTTKVTNGTGIKVISWDHFNYERFPIRWSHDIMLDCFKSGEVDKLVVLTKEDRRNFIEKEHLPENFVEYIYNPSPIKSNEYISHNEKKVLSIGRLTEQKGFDLLLKAWELVEKEVEDWCLEIVGSGVDEDKLHKMIKDFNLKRVIVSSYTNDVRSKYMNASIYCLPSRTEGFGLVIIEAATMSVPSVAFACGGPNEIISDGENGFLVERENYEVMAEKLVQLMNDDGLRVKMSYKCFEMSREFSIDNIMSKWVRLIDSL
ncbi:MAG: glycosyltransferase family 4 protein [Prevotella sp.]|nr:glycosyltransferase family 4 protein [Prevotella sp.]